MKRLVVGVAVALVACEEVSPPSPPVSGPPQVEAEVAAPALPPPPAPEPARVTWEVRSRRLEKDQTLATALARMQVPVEQAQEILGALSGVFQPRKARPGDELRVTTRLGQVELFEYRRSAIDEWYVRSEGNRFVGARRSLEVEKKVVPVAFAIEDSLYEAVRGAGEDPVLAMAIADAYAWDIDFYQDVRRGDRVRALVERFEARGRILRYGEILAADYDGQQVGRRRLFLYDDGKGASYYEEDGRSARKVFLKSPLKYAAVSSKYGMRKHPILGYMRAHQGVDFGASHGTPVWAVSDGTVTRAGYHGSNGNMVCVRHANALETCYGHLSRFGAVHVGKRVEQKHVVGYVGSTGLSTGPHLHYAVLKTGHFVNPQTLKFPRADPLRGEVLDDFRRSIEPWLARLDAPAVATSAPVGDNPTADSAGAEATTGAGLPASGGSSHPGG